MAWGVDGSLGLPRFRGQLEGARWTLPGGPPSFVQRQSPLVTHWDVTVDSFKATVHSPQAGAHHSGMVSKAVSSGGSRAQAGRSRVKIATFGWKEEGLSREPA